MRKFLLATSMLVAFSASAFAADMAVKAPPIMQSPFSSPTGSGFYVGLGTEGAVASADVSGNAIIGNVTASGATVGVDGGYIWGKCLLSSWCQLELDVKYQNITATNAGGSIISRWSASGEFDIGADVIQTVLGYLGQSAGSIFPSFNPTSLLPAAAVGNLASTPRPYLGFVGALYQVQGTVGSAQGQTFSFAPGAAAGYRWQTLTNGMPNGGSLNVFAKAVWVDRGVDVTGVFAGAGGAPINVQSHSGMSTVYTAGIHYDFGIR
jgi:hypothetical protein